MTALADIAGNFGSVLFYGATVLLVLTIVVFVHEMGHFLVARWCGVNVTTFSIGFGKELFGFYDSYGTRWRVAAIPLGGYVKFMDDDDAASATSKSAEEMTAEERAGAFHLKPIWQRAAVVAAGPLANFIFAVIVFAIMFMAYGIRAAEPLVDSVQPGGPAAVAGVQAGDKIVAINGSQTKSFSEVQRVVSISIDQPLKFDLLRDGQIVSVTITPAARTTDNGVGGKITRGLIGVVRSNAEFVERWPGPVEAIGLGVRETSFVITATLSYIRDIFVGRQDASQIGGLPHIAEATRQVVDISPQMLPHFIALISVSIGLINLFPIPLLDGGHLMFYAIEAVRRKPLSERVQDYAFRAGLTIVLMLMVYANVINGWPVFQKWLGLSG